MATNRIDILDAALLVSKTFKLVIALLTNDLNYLLKKPETKTLFL